MGHNYAFIGLGDMGFGMASNIRQKIPASSVLYVYDIFRPACEKFLSEFGHFGPIVIAESVVEVASNAKVLISSLPSSSVVRNVYLDETDGLIAATADPERLLLESSTIEMAFAQELAEKMAESGRGVYVDIPVSGGGAAAVGGKLSFMVGYTKPEKFDSIGLRIEKVLGMMGESKKCFWCGKIGAGLAAKISNNYISCTVYLVVAEAMAIGVRSGIDPKLLRDIIHNSSGQTFMGDIISNVPSAKLNGPHGFPVHLMIKDVSLGVDVGNETGVVPRMGLTALDIWKKAAEDPSIINQDGFNHSD